MFLFGFIRSSSGRGKGIQTLPMVTIAKETTLLVSRAGILVFPVVWFLENGLEKENLLKSFYIP